MECRNSPVNTPLPLDLPSRVGVVHHPGVLSLPRLGRSPLLLPTSTHSGPLRGILRHNGATSSPFCAQVWERRADTAEIAPHADSEHESVPHGPPTVRTTTYTTEPGQNPRPTRFLATCRPIWLTGGQFPAISWSEFACDAELVVGEDQAPTRLARRSASGQGEEQPVAGGNAKDDGGDDQHGHHANVRNATHLSASSIRASLAFSNSA